MKWKNQEIKTIEETVNALKEIYTKEEAQEFLRLAREENPQHADENIGYMFGYLDRDRWKELSELFGIKHPVFGDQYDLTDKEILAMGMERGRVSREARTKRLLHPKVAAAIQEIDAAIFNGDTFHNPESKEELRYYLERWRSELNELSTP